MDEKMLPSLMFETLEKIPLMKMWLTTKQAAPTNGFLTLSVYEASGCVILAFEFVADFGTQHGKKVFRLLVDVREILNGFDVDFAVYKVALQFGARFHELFTKEAVALNISLGGDPSSLQGEDHAAS